jgi:hypothetical protein
VEFFALIIIIVIAIVVIAYIQAVNTFNKKQGKKKGMEEKLSLLNDFSATQQLMGDDGNSGIAVDES